MAFLNKEQLAKSDFKKYSKNVFIFDKYSIYDAKNISIGYDVKIGHFNNNSLTNPTVPAEYNKVTSKPVTIDQHIVIGSGSVILPGIIIQKGCAIGAHSPVKNNSANYAPIQEYQQKRFLNETLN